ncbi:glycoprotein hormone beta-5-like [Melanotaenia boesemani]|uniref:glycoprotein hormone beta-5-like n=1 Tax=Melanotaenia boesemani TaxID=1250792 RepID=UPI001C053A24|nr:glycoprotein hormone beta-5-like [Melanotaenia boesemani]
MTLLRKKQPGRSGLMLSCFLLWMSLQPDSRNHVSAVNLRRFIGCAVREFIFLARKPGCGSLHITTDACWGRCETWEVRRREAFALLTSAASAGPSSHDQYCSRTTG